MKAYKKLNTLSFLAILAMSVVLIGFGSSPVLASSNPHNAISDSAITFNIKAKMAKDPTVSTTTISIETNDGVVSFSGSAKSETEATTAIQLAESTEGVKDVDVSNLMIEGSNQPFTDAIITAKIKGLLIREKVLGDMSTAAKIKVETKEGIVYLSGDIKNKKQEQNAIRLAKSIKGVKKIVSRLSIQR